MAINFEGFGYNEHTDRSGSFTLTAADSGVVQNITASTGTVVVTVPSTANGLTFLVRNQGGATVQVTPQAADGFTGNGYTATVNKHIQSTTSGDTVVVGGTGTAGVTAYIVREVSGSWTRQA